MQPTGLGGTPVPVTTQSTTAQDVSVTYNPQAWSSWSTYSIAGVPGIQATIGQKRPGESQPAAVKTGKVRIGERLVESGPMVAGLPEKLPDPGLSVTQWQPPSLPQYSLAGLQSGSSGLTASMKVVSHLPRSAAPHPGSHSGSTAKELGQAFNQFAQQISQLGMKVSGERLWDLIFYSPSEIVSRLMKTEDFVLIQWEDRLKIFTALSQAKEHYRHNLRVKPDFSQQSVVTANRAKATSTFKPSPVVSASSQFSSMFSTVLQGTAAQRKPAGQSRLDKNLAEIFNDLAAELSWFGVGVDGQELWKVSGYTASVALEKLIGKSRYYGLPDEARKKCLSVLNRARRRYDANMNIGNRPDFSGSEAREPLLPSSTSSTSVVSGFPSQYSGSWMARLLDPNWGGGVSLPRTSTQRPEKSAKEKPVAVVPPMPHVPSPAPLPPTEPLSVFFGGLEPESEFSAGDQSGGVEKPEQSRVSESPIETIDSSVSSSMTTSISSSFAEQISSSGSYLTNLFPGLPNRQGKNCYINAAVQLFKASLSEVEKRKLQELWQDKLRQEPGSLPENVPDAFGALLVSMHSQSADQVKKAFEVFVWNCWKDPEVTGAIGIRTRRGRGVPEDSGSLMECLDQRDSDEFLRTLGSVMAELLSTRPTLRMRAIFETEHAGVTFTKSPERVSPVPQRAPGAAPFPELEVSLASSGSIQDSIDDLFQKELLSGDEEVEWSDGDSNVQSSQPRASLPSGKYPTWKRHYLEANVSQLDRVRVNLAIDFRSKKEAKKIKKAPRDHVFLPVTLKAADTTGQGDFVLTAEPVSMICFFGRGLLSGHYVTLVKHEGQWVLVEDRLPAEIMPQPALHLLRRNLYPVVIDYQLTEKKRLAEEPQVKRKS
ncbi:MAG: hypothetical protein ACR2PT_19655 [Endozoicomonas sp.]